MDYRQAMNKINNRLRFGIKPGLERIEKLLELLGNPHKKLKFVHVAGTNGKGSTSALMASALTASGYKTGLYTSPYVLQFAERFRIDDYMIPERELIEEVETVSAAADKIEAGGETVTEFEFITALAFDWFCRSGCDIVVLEVGLGGRFDATNVIDLPMVSVIMSIDYDHTAILGETLSEIAFEKAGIIKNGGRTVMYPLQAEEARGVISNICTERGNKLTIPEAEKIEVISKSIKGSEFRYKDITLETPFLGDHQILNAVTAYTVLIELRNQGMKIPDEGIKNGFKTAFMPARMQIFSESPLIIADGGHNPGCAKVLAAAIKEHLPEKKITAAIGMMQDKDVSEYLKEISAVCSKIIAINISGDRAMPKEALAEIASKYCNNVTTAIDGETAINEALADITEDSAIVVCGSFFIMDEIKKGIDKKL